MGIVGIGAGIAEEHHGIFDRHHIGQPGGEIHTRLVGLATEHMTESQLLHLFGSSGDQFPVAIAQRGAPQPRHALEILLAMTIVDINPLAAIDGQLLNGLEVGCRVDDCTHFFAPLVSIAAPLSDRCHPCTGT